MKEILWMNGLMKNLEKAIFDHLKVPLQLHSSLSKNMMDPYDQ